MKCEHSYDTILYKYKIYEEKKIMRNQATCFDLHKDLLLSQYQELFPDERA